MNIHIRLVYMYSIWRECQSRCLNAPTLENVLIWIPTKACACAISTWSTIMGPKTPSISAVPIWS